jgi:hypothetical protein
MQCRQNCTKNDMDAQPSLQFYTRTLNNRDDISNGCTRLFPVQAASVRAVHLARNGRVHAQRGLETLGKRRQVPWANGALRAAQLRILPRQAKLAAQCMAFAFFV